MVEEMLRMFYVVIFIIFILSSDMREFFFMFNVVSDNNIKFFVVNKIFVEKSFEVLESFKIGICEFYDVEVGLVDFKLYVE